MNLPRMSFIRLPRLLSILPALLAVPCGAIAADSSPSITVHADQIKGPSSPILYGIMTEEINYSYDGGLYAELVRNRAFLDSADEPTHWSLVQDAGAAGTIALDKTQPLNDAMPVSLKLEITAGGAKQRAGIANDGYWGIPVRPATSYRASFYAKAAPGFSGPLTVSIESNDGSAVFAQANISKVTGAWKKYEVKLTTGRDVKPSATNRLVIRAGAPGTVWFGFVSLFPPTLNNRPNGLRPDIMQLLAEYKPAFLRFPGGNYLEGNNIKDYFNWKKTLGDVAQRPGHMSPWRYRSTDGMGLLEYLEWCEDLKMQPLLAVFAGLLLGQGGEILPGEALQPYVQDALDEIEYATGGTDTKWGAQRAKDGHPAPFKINYVEIGNEDWRGDYNGRFKQIHDAIKAKYPNIQIVDASIRGGVGPNGRLTSRVTDLTADVQDHHLYTNSELQSEFSSTSYDTYDRKGPKVFEGEWATRVPGTQPTPNFGGALGDAAYMTGFERNSDVVIMASYAPLFVNVSNALAGRGAPGSSMQWPVNLIGYDALGSYGSPAFYAQVMFNNNRGDQILASEAGGVGTRTWQAPAGRGGGEAPPPREVPTLFHSVTRDSKTGVIYLKIVNPLGTPQAVHVEIQGARSVAAKGESVIMKADSPEETNSLAEPKKIVPVTAAESGLGASFTRTLAPYSINILKLSSK
ncbi:MAG TPA: alpha-L-arabinofuranosidase C-terminal domain-containing protein [Opitutaceae bacterium]|nr:alpha-L-arabinofuranosidase C-terminal domain-containing protein [Opitutaceae bacterium]